MGLFGRGKISHKDFVMQSLGEPQYTEGRGLVPFLFSMVVKAVKHADTVYYVYPEDSDGNRTGQVIIIDDIRLFPVIDPYSQTKEWAGQGIILIQPHKYLGPDLTKEVEAVDVELHCTRGYSPFEDDKIEIKKGDFRSAALALGYEAATAKKDDDD